MKRTGVVQQRLSSGLTVVWKSSATYAKCVNCLFRTKIIIISFLLYIAWNWLSFLVLGIHPDQNENVWYTIWYTEWWRVRQTCPRLRTIKQLNKLGQGKNLYNNWIFMECTKQYKIHTKINRHISYWLLPCPMFIPTFCLCLRVGKMFSNDLTMIYYI